MTSLKPQPKWVFYKSKSENLVAMTDLDPRLYEGDQIKPRELTKPCRIVRKNKL